MSGAPYSAAALDRLADVAELELELDALAGAFAEMTRVANSPRDGLHSPRWLGCRAVALVHAERVAMLHLRRRNRNGSATMQGGRV